MKSQSSYNVFVGLSGGVDSAVGAALLHRSGYNVTGVFIKVWQPDWIECNWKDERRDAMRVAAHLGIPFVTLDLAKEYKDGVIDYMISEYRSGRTPNPDVMCNRQVKFGAFWTWAKSHGADYIATGHYAQNISLDIDGANLCLREAFSPLRQRRIGEKGSLRHASAPVNVRYSLLAGADKNKDQTYFLWTLTQDDLAHTIFPVGHLQKSEVRALARRFKLPNAEKKDSQGLCFIGKVDVKDFLSHYIETEPGNVLDEGGEIIGSHPGALFFTIGERHGFTITRKSPNESRYYVVDKDMDQNTITVSNKAENPQSKDSVKIVRLTHINWIKGSAWDMQVNSTDEYPYQARIRYRQSLQDMKVSSISVSGMILEFRVPIEYLTPGQSLVIYSGEECLGGGIIE